ncbi:MAG: glycoside hydrolase family 28 protein, partial [Asticcacaulis sp.]
IDACRRVTIRHCRVNTPNDDAIVLKSSYALGEARACEDITVENCTVSGYDLGTMLDGTQGRTQERSPDQDRVTGRIKIGTESNGGFKRIRIRNCRFERSRGLALETVDGGWIEDVVCEDLTLSEITTAPIFLRVGARLRGPEGTVVGGIRHVVLRNITATDILPDYAALIMGLPESPIEDVTLDNIRLTYRGGLSAADVAPFRDDLPTAYPEPSMFGVTPAWGLWVRHVERLTLGDVTLATDTPDSREERVFHGVSLTR